MHWPALILLFCFDAVMKATQENKGNMKHSADIKADGVNGIKW